MSMTKEYAYEPGMIQLEPGDVVQLDGGPQIVTRANESGATCEPVGKKHIEGETRFGKKFSMDVKLKGATHISRMVPKWLVIERRGEQGLANYTAAKKGMDGMITLELGDCICHGGEWRTVVKVYEHSCIIGNLDGYEFTEKRVVNEFFTKECGSAKRVRFDAMQRAAHLAEFLQQRKSPQPETNETSDETTANESEKPMAKKEKQVKQKKVAAVKKAAKSVVSYAGRPEFIAKLIAKGEKDAEIMKAVKVEYPGSSACNVIKTIASKRAKAEKAK